MPSAKNKSGSRAVPSGNPYLGIVEQPLSINADDASAWGATEGTSDTNDMGSSKTPGHGSDAHGSPDESPVQRLQKRQAPLKVDR